MASTAQKRCACGWLVNDTGEASNTCGAWECMLASLGEGKLILEREEGGWRHYLHGEAISCGSGLELAGVDWVDGGDCGAVAKTAMPRRWRRVRYESPLSSNREPPALLYIDVDGHSAVITAHAGMLFRWPGRHR